MYPFYATMVSRYLVPGQNKNHMAAKKLFSPGKYLF